MVAKSGLNGRCPRHAAVASRRVASDRMLKKSMLLEMMSRDFGASLAELARETGWQEKSIRATLTNLRNDGQPIYKLKIEEITRYRLAS